MGTDEFCSGQEAAGNPSHLPRRAAAVDPDARYRELFGAAAEIVDGIERIKELIAAEGETIALKDGRLNMHLESARSGSSTPRW